MFFGFFGDRRGNFAIMLAIMSVPLLGMVGFAIDYNRIVNAKTFFQDQADIAALTIAGRGAQAAPVSSKEEREEFIAKHTGEMRRLVEQRYAGQLVGGVTGSAAWNGDYSNVQVDVSGTIKNHFMHIVSASHATTQINIVSVVSVRRQFSKPGEPEILPMEPEAIDYNLLYVYCYDPEAKTRTQMARLKDNAKINNNNGTKFPDAFPDCGDNAFLSYRLRSVRDARDHPHRWNDHGTDRYADTVIVHGVSHITASEEEGGGAQKMLETVMCSSKEKCKSRKENGEIPDGRDRWPEKTSKSCQPGKYLYYGWEDRARNIDGDNDFNDIRLIIPCDAGEVREEKPNIWISR